MKTYSIDEKISFTSIGMIHSPHLTPAGTPIQPSYATQCEGQVVVKPEFQEALTDIEGFERVWLLYFFDRAAHFKSHVIPYRDTIKHGLFATRAPCRPNPIGLSVVRLSGRRDNVLNVKGIDILDSTPLLDIKPYVPEFDVHLPSKAGWLDDKRADRRKADDRFHGKAD